jgi:dTDP-4-dehydrorhamnose 3,5-epimerase-like enzyme
VLRGMHRSIYSKLVSVLRGEVVDVIVDLRPWSKVWQHARR